LASRLDLFKNRWKTQAKQNSSCFGHRGGGGKNFPESAAVVKEFGEKRDSKLKTKNTTARQYWMKKKGENSIGGVIRQRLKVQKVVRGKDDPPVTYCSTFNRWKIAKVLRLQEIMEIEGGLRKGEEEKWTSNEVKTPSIGAVQRTPNKREILKVHGKGGQRGSNRAQIRKRQTSNRTNLREKTRPTKIQRKPHRGIV